MIIRIRSTSVLGGGRYSDVHKCLFVCPCISLIAVYMEVSAAAAVVCV